MSCRAAAWYSGSSETDRMASRCSLVMSKPVQLSVRVSGSQANRSAMLSGMTASSGMRRRSERTRWMGRSSRLRRMSICSSSRRMLSSRLRIAWICCWIFRKSPATVVNRTCRKRARSRAEYSTLRSACVRASRTTFRPARNSSGCVRENARLVAELDVPPPKSHRVLLASSTASCVPAGKS